MKWLIDNPKFLIIAGIVLLIIGFSAFVQGFSSEEMEKWMQLSIQDLKVSDILALMLYYTLIRNVFKNKQQ